MPEAGGKRFTRNPRLSGSGEAVLAEVSVALAGWKPFMQSVRSTSQSEEVIAEAAQAFVVAGVHDVDSAAGVLDNGVGNVE